MGPRPRPGSELNCKHCPWRHPWTEAPETELTLSILIQKEVVLGPDVPESCRSIANLQASEELSPWRFPSAGSPLSTPGSDELLDRGEWSAPGRSRQSRSRCAPLPGAVLHPDDPDGETACLESPTRAKIVCLLICYIMTYSVHVCMCIYNNWT